MLVCPHCTTKVPEQASVCAGCGAEIVRGATRRERSAAGCVVALVALVVALTIAGMGPMPGPYEDAAFFLILKLIAVVLVANAIGRLAMRLARRSKLRFIRLYENH